MTVKTVTNRGAEPLIASRKAFTNHSKAFRAESRENGYINRYPGWMPEGFIPSMREADYIVYSFQTPIGWHIEGHGWVVPEVSYSQRTNRHQSILRSAVWDEIVLKPSWTCVQGSETAARILRSIREGVNVDIRTRTKRIVDLVVATGEAHVVAKDGLTYLAPVS